jgi:hypothetical protein
MAWSATYVVAFIAATTLPLWYEHARLHSGGAAHHVTFGLHLLTGPTAALHPVQAGLALFCSVNLLICIWELALFYERKTIRAHFAAMMKLLPSGTLPQPMFLFEHVR